MQRMPMIIHTRSKNIQEHVVPTNNNLVVNKTKTVTNNKFTSLTGSMIDRVYKAKPGCSACGKKVA